MPRSGRLASPRRPSPRRHRRPVGRGAASPAPIPEPAGTIRLYTSVTQATVDAVVAAYAAAHPGVTVEVFRAPTGELAARIAAELRDGRILGDVLWLTDPLSIQAYADQGLLRAWEPAEAAGDRSRLPRRRRYWGTRFLNMVIVRGSGVDARSAVDWSDLADPAYRDAVAIPDPGFAGSAFGALGYFALSTDAGLDFYRRSRPTARSRSRPPTR